MTLLLTDITGLTLDQLQYMKKRERQREKRREERLLLELRRIDNIPIEIQEYSNCEDCDKVCQIPCQCQQDCFISEQEIEWTARDPLDTISEKLEDFATEDLEDDELEDEFIEMDTEDLPISHLVRCSSIRVW